MSVHMHDECSGVYHNLMLQAKQAVLMLQATATGPFVGIVFITFQVNQAPALHSA